MEQLVRPRDIFYAEVGRVVRIVGDGNVVGVGVIHHAGRDAVDVGGGVHGPGSVGEVREISPDRIGETGGAGGVGVGV